MNGEDAVTTVDEAITVVPYDPRWPRSYRVEAARVRAALGSTAVAVEHFGSTAVPGLAAKPIVDILVGLHSIPPSASIGTALRDLGYASLGEAGVPGRHAFRLRQPQAVNLALVQWDGPLWRDNLLIRDYLRAHPAVAQRYAAEKRARSTRGHPRCLRTRSTKGCSSRRSSTKPVPGPHGVEGDATGKASQT